MTMITVQTNDMSTVTLSGMIVAKKFFGNLRNIFHSFPRLFFVSCPQAPKISVFLLLRKVIAWGNFCASLHKTLISVSVGALKGNSAWIVRDKIYFTGKVAGEFS